jgi:hypothetical protein
MRPFSRDHHKWKLAGDDQAGEPWRQMHLGKSSHFMALHSYRYNPYEGWKPAPRSGQIRR